MMEFQVLLHLEGTCFFSAPYIEKSSAMLMVSAYFHPKAVVTTHVLVSTRR
jgi:hypothetical protein